jgi:hypothetical protein
MEADCIEARAAARPPRRARRPLAAGIPLSGINSLRFSRRRRALLSRKVKSCAPPGA